MIRQNGPCQRGIILVTRLNESRADRRLLAQLRTLRTFRVIVEREGTITRVFR